METFKDYRAEEYVIDQIIKDISEDKAKIDDKKHIQAEILRNTANILVSGTKNRGLKRC